MCPVQHEQAHEEADGESISMTDEWDQGGFAFAMGQGLSAGKGGMDLGRLTVESQP